MRKFNLFRSVLAAGAVLAVAGPGLVLAGGGPPNYAPKVLQVLGPSSVPTGGSGVYTARVTFTNNATFDFSGAPVTCTAARGSITDGFNYTAPATSGRDSIRCTYTNQGVTVTGAKIILNP
jgi:hypothetical protein